MGSIDLNGIWRLYPLDVDKIRKYTNLFDKKQHLEMEIPGDIHSTFIENNIIPNPYWGEKELDVQWVGKNDWIIEKDFYIEEPKNAKISFTFLDTITEIYLNDKKVGETNNMFRKWDFDVTSFIKRGKNIIKIIFLSAENAAKKENEKLPYPIPYSEYPVFSPYRNLIRKAQCHSGWDWGPCIMAFGIYEKINFSLGEKVWINSKDIVIEHIDTNAWIVKMNLDCTFNTRERVLFTLQVADHSISKYFSSNDDIELYLKIENPELWFPAGYGKQPLYQLSLIIEEHSVYETKIGFRDLETVNEKDKNGGISLYFRVNGKKVFSKGANWIPIDALPKRQTENRYRKLLSDMIAANMNTVRVWGGGQYEYDFFYGICDELGILVWQDMMFACAMYPATESFLDNVSEEIRYQISRLKIHPSIAIWCGNNEDLGAIGWYEESKNNRDRYVQDYLKLNDDTIGVLVKKLDPSRRWWPSSPSAGEGDFSDNWHSDNKGDMHYWSVWHDGMQFNAYYLIKPRFVSEFGFQSFPTFDAIEQYATQDDFDCYTPVMLHHQKNPAGNEIISTTMERYYGKPKDFRKFVYISQIQQADAMRIAIEYYRSLMPYTMGTLYWQLNDNWPVASWSGIDYSGKWKALHYKAKHFYSPIHLASILKDGSASISLINESNETINTKIIVKKINYGGEILTIKEIDANSKAMDVFNCNLDFTPSSEEYIYAYCNIFGKKYSTFLLPEFPKDAKLENPKIEYEVKQIESNKFTIVIKNKKPCFDLMLFASIDGKFLDNVISMNANDIVEIDFITEESRSPEEVFNSISYLDLYSARY